MKQQFRILPLVVLTTFLLSFILFASSGLFAKGAVPGAGINKQITEKQLTSGRFLQASENDENEIEADNGLRAQLATILFDFRLFGSSPPASVTASDSPRGNHHPIFLQVRNFRL